MLKVGGLKPDQVLEAATKADGGNPASTLAGMMVSEVVLVTSQRVG